MTNQNDGKSPVHRCPLCGEVGEPDDRRPAEIAGVEFHSVICTSTDMIVHPFPVRWLEADVADEAELEDFEDRFTFVRGPLPEGSAIEEIFDDRDPIEAWIETEDMDGRIRLLIRL